MIIHTKNGSVKKIFQNCRIIQAKIKILLQLKSLNEFPEKKNISQNPRKA